MWLSSQQLTGIIGPNHALIHSVTIKIIHLFFDNLIFIFLRVQDFGEILTDYEKCDLKYLNHKHFFCLKNLVGKITNFTWYPMKFVGVDEL